MPFIDPISQPGEGAQQPCGRATEFQPFMTAAQHGKPSLDLLRQRLLRQCRLQECLRRMRGRQSPLREGFLIFEFGVLAEGCDP